MFVDHAWLQVGFNEGKHLHFRRDFSEAPSTSTHQHPRALAEASRGIRDSFWKAVPACTRTIPLAQLRVHRAGAARACPLQLLTGWSREPNRCCLATPYLLPRSGSCTAPDPLLGELINLTAHEKLISFSGLVSPEFFPAANARRKIFQPCSLTRLRDGSWG